jgi:aerobic carbon-monoxide dehydrogenase large subunit
VRGRGSYTDDIEVSNAAHMAVVRSPHAAARITGVEVSDALAAVIAGPSPSLLRLLRVR